MMPYLNSSGYLKIIAPPAINPIQIREEISPKKRAWAKYFAPLERFLPISLEMYSLIPKIETN